MISNYVSPLKIGKLSFSTNLIQAPLAGISCAAFRDRVWEFGSIAYCCTEMQSAQQLAQGGKRAARFHYRSPLESTLCWQLSGNNPDHLTKACEIAVESGADLIDLNCGCPMPKIRQKGCGSKLLSEAKRLRQLITSMKQASHVPITVKIRVDSRSGDSFNHDVARMIEDGGADAIIVHGRHWQEHYETPCRLDDIASVVSAVTIPVIGNGDINDSLSLKRMIDTTHCSGIMIGRASIGRPWLFHQLTLEDQQQEFSEPNLRDTGKILWQHIHALAQLEPEKIAVYQSRRLAQHYVTALPTQRDFKNAMNACSSLLELYSLIAQHFGTPIETILPS